MAILRTPKENKALFAEDGIARWEAPPLARKIAERIRENGEETILNKADIAVINKIAQLLRTGKRFPSPFKSIAIDLQEITVVTSEILRVFE